MRHDAEPEMTLPPPERERRLLPEPPPEPPMTAAEVEATLGGMRKRDEWDGEHREAARKEARDG